MQLPLRQSRAEGLTSKALAQRKAEGGGGGRVKQDRLWVLGVVPAVTADGLFCQELGFDPTQLVPPTLSQSRYFAVVRRESCSKHGLAFTFET